MRELDDSVAVADNELEEARKPIGDVDEVFADLGHGSEPVAKVLQQLREVMLHEAPEPSALQTAVRAVVEQAAGTPYFDLTDYMERTWLREKREGMRYAARVHKVLRSDEDRALHDHPWQNASIVLDGGYWEVVPGLFQALLEKHFQGRCAASFKIEGDTQDLEEEVLVLDKIVREKPGSEVDAEMHEQLRKLGVVWRAPMSYVCRPASALHRLIVPQGRSAWSLFVMRPKIREWGFLTIDGWVHWDPYLQALGREA